MSMYRISENKAIIVGRTGVMLVYDDGVHEVFDKGNKIPKQDRLKFFGYAGIKPRVDRNIGILNKSCAEINADIIID